MYDAKEIRWPLVLQMTSNENETIQMERYRFWKLLSNAMAGIFLVGQVDTVLHKIICALKKFTRLRRHLTVMCYTVWWIILIDCNINATVTM